MEYDGSNVYNIRKYLINEEITLSNKVIEPITENKNRTCFIVTPIGDEMDPIRRHINGIIDAAIHPIIQGDFNLKVAHREFSSTSIPKQVIQLIYQSDLVIANLTGLNPNVMYELAVRHCIGSPVIIIAEEGTKLPFDIHTERTIFYVNDAQGVLDLQERLAECLKAIQFNEKPKSPVYDALRAASIENEIIKDINIRGEENAAEYLIKKLDDLERAVAKLGDTTTKKDSEFSYRALTEDVLYFHQKLSFQDPVNIVLQNSTYMQELVDLQRAFRSIAKTCPPNIYSSIKRELRACERMLRTGKD